MLDVVTRLQVETCGMTQPLPGKGGNAPEEGGVPQRCGLRMAGKVLVATATLVLVGLTLLALLSSTARSESGPSSEAAEGALDVDALLSSTARSDAPDGLSEPDTDVLLSGAELPSEAGPSATNATAASPEEPSAVEVSWSPHQLPRRLDWLHIPKCGTTFLHHLLHFNCDKEISKDLGHRYDDEALALEYANSRPYEYTAIHGGRHYHCQGGLRFFHRPISRKHGHGTTPVENVVTYFREPILRVASGFVHGFHDCSQVRGMAGMTARHACEAFTGNDTSAEVLDRAKRAARLYAKCVTGCQGRMLTGSGCGSGTHANATPSAESLAPRVANAVAKLRRLAFVGIVEHWSASECVFERDFPRRSGRKYPAVANMRPSPNHQCELKVSTYLREIGTVDALDSAVYDAALAEFSRRVGNCTKIADSVQRSDARARRPRRGLEARLAESRLSTT
jgi:hypothetical protein